MSAVMEKPFIDQVFEGRNQSFGAYFLRRIYEKHIFTAVIVSLSVFSLAIASPFIYNKFFVKEEVAEKVQMVEVVLEEIPSIAPEEQLPPPPPPANFEAPKVSKVKFLPPVVKPDNEVEIDEVPPTTEDLKESNPGDVTQEGETLNELVDVDTKAQAVVETKVEDNQVYTWVEQQAEFQGGIENFKKFLTQNLRYPEEAQKKQISDFVVVSFIINKDGSITDVRVEKSAGYGMDEEAVRVIKAMPNWTPAKQNGSAARQRKSIKIPFILK